MYKNYFKPLLDFLTAFIGLLLVSPIFIVATISLYFANHGKPFFLQTRPGKEGRLFKIIKFKTMNDKKDPQGNLLPDAQRLTKIGSFIRKTSLDEIPQLLNVLKGDMSFIGPRPLLIKYLPYYSTLERKRHNVKPGITGWAQVNGRNTLVWNKRLAMDVYYVENVSFALDIKIILITLKKVIGGSDIVVDTSAVMQDLDKERQNDYQRN